MIKQLLLGLFLLLSLTFSSCEKLEDWECTCYLDGLLFDSQVFYSTTKSDAEDQCDELEQIYLTASPNVTCTLKSF